MYPHDNDQHNLQDGHQHPHDNDWYRQARRNRQKGIKPEKKIASLY